MFQCQSNWVAGYLRISERQVLAHTQQRLEMDVSLHADYDGRTSGSHVFLSVSADQDEGVGHGAGGGHDHNVPQQVSRCHLSRVFNIVVINEVECPSLE